MALSKARAIKTETETMDFTAIWLESAYQIGRCYDMSTDSVRPRADFVSREYFARVYDAGFVPDKTGALDVGCRAWIWQWANSGKLTMANPPTQKPTI